MSWLTGLFDFAGGMMGAGLNYKGAREANEMNKKLSREQMDFQRESTREQMAFQERMSNTAYQRAMQDMRSAGMNPILAFNQGGASTPAGSSAGGAQATMHNVFSSAVASAQRMRMISAQVEQQKALAEIMKAEVVGKKLEADIYKTKMGKFAKFLKMFAEPAASALSYFKGRGL